MRNGNFERNLAIVRRVEELASQKGIAPAQLALAWVMHQGEDVVPIPGTRRRERLEQNAAAVEVGLSPEDLAALDELEAPIGDRYADMSSVDR